jgi:valyl-tRNA synthetase
VSEGGDNAIYAVAADVLGAVRKEKALAKVSLKVPAERVTVCDAPERLAMLRLVEGDLREAGNIRALELLEAQEPSVETVLAAPEPA